MDTSLMIVLETPQQKPYLLQVKKKKKKINYIIKINLFVYSWA